MTSWNGPDRAGFELDLCIALMLAAETAALALVCLRLISMFSPDMVQLGNLSWLLRTVLAVTNSSTSTEHSLDIKSAEQSTDDGRLAQGSTKVLGCEVSQGAAKWP